MGNDAGRPLAWSLALRFLGSARKDSFTRFLSLTAAGGMAVGIAALILALAALSGFQRALKSEILARTPEIEIALPAGADEAAVRANLGSAEGVERAQAVNRGQGWLVSAGSVRPLELVGFEGIPPTTFQNLRGGGSGIYLSAELADLLALEVGGQIELASARPTLTPFGPQPRVLRLELAGTFPRGRTEQIERAAVPLDAADRLLGPGGRRLLVTTGSLEKALQLAPDLADLLPEGSTVRTWRQLNRALFFALKLEKSLMFLAVFLIVVVAALALVSDLNLLIAAKQREIGMLGAMGAEPRLLVRVFVLLGAALAFGGLALGAIAGTAGAWLLDRYRILRLPGEVYFLDYVPFAVGGWDVVAIGLATAAIALGAALYGSRAAASLKPTEALRG